MKASTQIAAALSLVLSACTATSAFQSNSAQAPISGTVTRSQFEPARIDVTLEGKQYHGEWRTTAPTREQRAVTTYPHRWHIGQVYSVLIADDGSKVDCHWLTHGDSAIGGCISGQTTYPLAVK